MDVLRSAKISVYNDLRASSMGGDFGAAYNVYNETDLRDGTALTEPHIYLLDYGVFYRMEHLPVILVQCEMEDFALQLGTGDVFLVNLALHIVGDNRGRRDDLLSAIMRLKHTFDLYNHMVSPPVFVEAVSLQEDGRGREWSELDLGNLPVELVREGTLANWQPIATRFLLVGASSWPTS